MHPRRLRYLALPASVLLVLACSSASDSADNGDGITQDELVQGSGCANANGDCPEAEDSLDLADDSSGDDPFADNSPVDNGDDAGTDDAGDGDDAAADDDGGDDAGDDANADLSSQSDPMGMSCTSATGYRRGSPFTICTTTIDGKPVETSTAAAFQKMRAAAKRAGVNIHVVSGFRTMAQQRHLYSLYKSGKGNLAAVPGFSNHQSGHALDLNTKAPGVYSWLSAHGSAYGFRRTVPSEKWHWEHW